MKKCLAIICFALIIASLCGCKNQPRQHAAQAPDPHQALGEHVKKSLQDAMMPGWQLAKFEECAVPPGWIGNGTKGWHVVVVAPDTEAGAQYCNFWVFPADWTGQKQPLPRGSETPTAFYYCQGEEVMLFTQPPADPAVTQIAIGQVAQALQVPDARGEIASQTAERAKEIKTQLLAAAGPNGATLRKMAPRVVESKFSVSAFTGGCANEDVAMLAGVLKKTFPDKRTFIIHRDGTDFQDSIIVSGNK